MDGQRGRHRSSDHNAANAHSGSSYAYISTPANYTNTTLTTTQPSLRKKAKPITATGWVYHETGSGYTRWCYRSGTNGGITVHLRTISR